MFENVTPAQAEAVLGAMSTVVDYDSAEGGGQQMVDAAAAIMFDSPRGPEAGPVDPVPPDRLRKALGKDPDLAAHAVELVAVASLADGHVEADRLRWVLGYADTLGVREAWTRVLADVAEGRTEKAMAAMVRSNAATFPGLAGRDGMPEMLCYTGRGDSDKRLLERFEGLEDYRRGTFGHAFWVHFRRHGFRFPGQEGAFNGAFAVPHDGLHVLTGYDTSMQGELLVSTFTGEMHGVEALSAHLLPVIFEWHIGVEVNGIGAQHGALDPWKFLYAWRRGNATAVDVLDAGWSFFDVADQSLEEVRGHYGIPQLPGRFRASGPEVNFTDEADPSVN
jgi:hypothetical protein